MNSNVDYGNSKARYYSNSQNVKSEDSTDLVFDNKYKDGIKNAVDLPNSAIEYLDEDGKTITVNVEDLFPSQLNPYYNVRILSNDGSNYPVTDIESGQNEFLYKEISAMDLINNDRGASIYDAEDFLYLKKFNKVKLNRLITLRRFAHPIFDDIFSKGVQSEPDISRLLTYSDQETNKISDILGFNMSLSWKELEAKNEPMQMEGSQHGVSGIAGTMMRFLDPKFGKEEMMGANRVNYNPYNDENRTFGQVDSIAKTHIRDVGVNFEQDMTLTFEFEMRSHDGINQKTAFIDLLSNIILMCTNDAKFWGGARYWIGVKPSKYMKSLKALESSNWQEFVSKSMDGMKSFLKGFEAKGSAKELLKNIANNAMNIAMGKLMNVIGRASVPVMNSLLTGNPVGMWHITVGNPLNPIMVMGDMLITNAKVTLGDELGYDDFPTEIRVDITLKHCKPRGRAEIENMFNCGKGRVYLKPKDVFKNNTTTKDNPSTLGSQKSNNKNNKFREYTFADVERNSRELWSFLTDKKT